MYLIFDSKGDYLLTVKTINDIVLLDAEDGSIVWGKDWEEQNKYAIYFNRVWTPYHEEDVLNKIKAYILLIT